VSDPTHAAGDAAARAKVLVWQGGFRMGLAGAIAGGALVLRAVGVVSTESLGARWIGVRAAGQSVAVVVALYVLLVAVTRRRLRRRRMASRTLVRAQVALDVLVIHLCALLLTPPDLYDRTLILSMFLVQFTQLYFGWRTTLVQIGSVAICYAALVTFARLAGMIGSPNEQFWTFVLFFVGTVTYAWMLGHQGVRMKRLMHLFDRAREGHFDQPYEEGRDRFPDYITQIGHSYNDLRGHLETIVLTDPLSGCFNRRGFQQMASRELSRSIRAKWHLAMLALDVDHFKSVNDDFGHLTGDEAIREIGALVRETARAGDVVARTGGEEFCILAPDTDEAGAMHLADRILHAFRSQPFTSLRGRMSITVSIGVASDDAASADVVRALTARADEALYVAKRNGRDQAVAWQPGMRAFDVAGERLSREP